MGGGRQDTGAQGTADAILELAPTITLQSLGDGEGALVLRRDTGEMLVLNDTARDFLAALDGSSTIAAIAARLAETYDVEVPRLLADLIELSGEMREEGVVIASG